MNKWLKILCLVLVMAFILPALVACDNTDDPGTTPNEPSGVVLDPPATLDGTKYGNKNFTIYALSDMFHTKYFYAEKTTGDGMNDSLYQRQQTIEKLLEIKFVYKEAEGVGEAAAFEVYADEVKNAIKSGTEKYQLVGTHAYHAIPDLITSDSLMDFNEFESIDLTKDYWNKDVMDQVAFKGHYYLGYSDYNLATTYTVAFNKTLYNEFASAFNGNSMYDYVRNGQWTLQKMSEVASYVYKDEGGIENNTYGLTGELWVPFCGFLQSSGESIVKKNDNSGKYEITWYDNTTIKSKINSLIETLKDLHEMKETHFWVNAAPQFVGKGDATQVKLSGGKAFMELVNTIELIYLKETQVKFGVVPYPMYDTDQYNTVGYQSLNWAGYLAVPSNNTNKKMISDVLECMAYYSGDVTTYYYEKLLGLKVSEAPDDAAMLDIIWDSLCSDFGVVYGMIGDKMPLTNFTYGVPNCILDNKSFAAYNAQFVGSAKRAIDNNINK